MNPTTGKRGEIAFDLSLKITEAPLTSAERCRRWVNEQVAENIRRGSCSTSCAPNLQLAFLSLGSKFITNYRRFKAGLSTELENLCIFSDQISTGNSADECCYRFLGDKFSYDQSFITNQYQSFFLSSSSLINAGPGHWHQFHPRHDFMKFQEEENHYQECCTNISSTQESCSLFYSVRPICNDEFWTFPTTWGTQLLCIFNFNCSTNKHMLYSMFICASQQLLTFEKLISIERAIIKDYIISQHGWFL